MKRPITRKRINRVWLGLQSVAFAAGVSAQNRGRVHSAMDLLSQIQAGMRRHEIYATGARARKPIPKFDSQPLGSSESMTFYDGYASTHPKFQNPYRARH